MKEDNNYSAGFLLTACLKQSRGMIFLYLGMSILNLSVFLLYQLNLEPFIYTELLTLLGVLIYILYTCYRERERAAERARTIEGIQHEWKNLPDPHSLAEEDYQEMLRRLGSQAEHAASAFARDREDMLDYYTIWVHQIKTPIAVMRMRLGIQDTEENRALSAELFRIEQYVDMVLQYIRLGSDQNDLVIEDQDLDEMIRECIRKYAPQFIQRKLRVSFEASGRHVVTDRKWFCCILDQLLSNAVKYTPQGGITIEVTPEGKVKVSDTGIGIAAEDIPRVFDKGFTGINGRGGFKSSGLGLYLCRKAANLLSIDIKVESQVGKGSTFILDMNQDKKKYD